MSCIKRYLDDEIERISKKSGYSWDFLMDIAMDEFESDGEIDLKYIEGVAMERDF